jgi:D-3-phosphoglycerate dehydrogenase
MPAEKTSIVISEPLGFPDEAATLLRRVGDLFFADSDRQGLLSAVSKAHVLWVRLRHRIDAEIIAAAPQLKVIVSPTTGLNHIDVAEAGSRGVQILSLQENADFLRYVRATAEHCFGLMLALLRHVPSALNHVLEGGWNRDLFKGSELYEKTVGIVGYGRLGRIVGRYLQAIDARVLATDPRVQANAVEPGITLVSLSTLLQESDLVTLHLNLSTESRGLFGQQQFAQMKRGAWFINTARGELIDENALLNALRSGHLRGAALDVLSDEYAGNIEHHPLVAYAREHDNLIITPHIGGCTAESMKKTECFLAYRLLTLLESEETLSAR